MKQGTIINRIIMLLLMGVILLYLGGAAWRGLRDPYPTVQAYSYQVDDALEATGYLVREEQVLTGSGGIVRLTPAEGEKVSAGATVALLYADEAALERDQRLETLQAEESQLSSAIALAGESSQQTERSSQVVLEALTKLRAAVESGDFTRLESQTSAFKSAVYQQAQRYGDADELQAALSATRSEIDSLRAQNSRDMGRVTTAQSGIFSGQVDGYETILTPETVTALTPQQLESLEDRAHPVGAGSLAKIITDSTWYFAALLPSAGTELQSGRTYTLNFSGDYFGQIPMKLERMALDGDQTLAIFSCRSHLSDTTMMRVQTVDVVIRQIEGIRIPRKALRVETETITNDDGSTREVNHYKVYTVIRSQAWGQEVEVLYTDNNFYLVRPVDENASDRLRAGDEVILSSADIYDGKVVR